jgi:hypothetical protein
MAHARTALVLLAAILSLALTGASSSALNDDFKVIVHPSNPVSVVSRDFLRAAFLKKVIKWQHGEPLRPIDLTEKLGARQRFTEEVLLKSPAQLRSYWIQRIFSGTGVPPVETDSPAAAIAHVLADPGAVAYLPIHVDSGRAKVVMLK